MSAPTTANCPLGLTPDDLSAWRDHTLPSDEAQRITAHLASCPACQRIIAADDMLAAALAADQPPAPDAQNWLRLQARISGNQRPTPNHRRASRRALWSGLAAAAAVLLISALFMQLFGQLALRRGVDSHHKTTAASTPPALASVPPTAPIAGPALNWQNQSAPASVVPPPGNQTMVSNFAYAPTDAQTAYICSFEGSAAKNTPISIWAKHDSATTWKHVSDIPFTGYDPECLLAVDAHNPQHVSLAVWGHDVQTYKGIGVTYISDDGAQTWRALSDSILMSGLATHDQTGLAVSAPLANFFDVTHSQPYRLVATHDDWRTWSPIDSPLLAQGYIVSHVWQRPSDGALLAEVVQRQTKLINGSPTPSTDTTGDPIPTSLWQSMDIGAHWTPLPAPPNLIATLGFVVAQPQGNLPWRACGLTRSGAGKTLSQLIGCTVDGGQTWTSRPLPALTENCGSGCSQQQIIGGWTTALMSDNSLITIFYAGPTDPGVQATYSMYHIFRLAPRSTQWQDLGPEPNNGLIGLDTAPTGTLISVTGGMSMDGVSGSIVGHLGGDVPNRGIFAAATVP